jgi:hypothetical protein
MYCAAEQRGKFVRTGRVGINSGVLPDHAILERGGRAQARPFFIS